MPFFDGNMAASGDRHEEAGNRYRRHRIDRNTCFCAGPAARRLA
jgi:hypothetical protein